MPRKRKEASVPDGAPAWMVTYGDMVTLLLCFFVLLFSFSVIDQVRFQQIMASIQIAFMGERGIMQASPEVSRQQHLELIVPHRFDEVLVTYHVVQDFVQEERLEEMVSLRVEERGVVLEIQDQILFDSGRADLKPGAVPLLDKVAVILQRVPNKVIVEGHTDNVPISTVFFPSNWELSVGRAVRVVRALSEQRELDPRRFVATGFGEYHPVATNQTALGRSRNRRVNIIISDVIPAEGEGGQHEEGAR
ncbi:MAG: Motility protein B [Syntrophomonadaceae bacterium]|nr:Motility protein B [Bacillota bacterium]